MELEQGSSEDYKNSLLAMEIKFMILHKTIICHLEKKNQTQKHFLLMSFSVF